MTDDFSFGRGIGRSIAATAETMIDLRLQREAREANQRAAQAEKKVAELRLYNSEWSEYAENLKKKIDHLENSLKRQSANMKGIKAVRDFIVNELKDIQDPKVQAAIDQKTRQKIFEENYDKFMRGDSLV